MDFKAMHIQTRLDATSTGLLATEPTQTTLDMKTPDGSTGKGTVYSSPEGKVAMVTQANGVTHLLTSTGKVVSIFKTEKMGEVVNVDGGALAALPQPGLTKEMLTDLRQSDANIKAHATLMPSITGMLQSLLIKPDVATGAMVDNQYYSLTTPGGISKYCRALNSKIVLDVRNSYNSEQMKSMFGKYYLQQLEDDIMEMQRLDPTLFGDAPGAVAVVKHETATGMVDQQPMLKKSIRALRAGQPTGRVPPIMKAATGMVSGNVRICG